MLYIYIYVYIQAVVLGGWVAFFNKLVDRVGKLFLLVVMFYKKKKKRCMIGMICLVDECCWIGG